MKIILDNNELKICWKCGKDEFKTIENEKGYVQCVECNSFNAVSFKPEEKTEV